MVENKGVISTVYTICPQLPASFATAQYLQRMANQPRIYTRHTQTCAYRSKPQQRQQTRCGCPLWFQRDRKRWSAKTNDWDVAMRKAAELSQTVKEPSGDITVEKAVELYLLHRSKKLRDANSAPYKDRYMLRNGSKKQMSLQQWANQEKFTRLNEITPLTLDQWRNDWVFRDKSFSMRVHNSMVKAFFRWCVRFDYLARNPMDKLDPLHVVEVPTLPLEPEELTRLLAAVSVLPPAEQTVFTALLLTIRWSGLAITDACTLPRTRLDSQNRLQTYRQKTGEFVHVLLPSFVAHMLRQHRNPINPEYFFWNKWKFKSPLQQSQWFNKRMRRVYDSAKINPRGFHRLRDTFAVEFLNADGNVENLAMLLGHKNSNITRKHYMPWVKSRQIRLDQAVERNLAIQLQKQPQQAEPLLVQ
jgi:integrase